MTAHDKRYVAQISFGKSTNTLDAEGETTGEAELSPSLLAELRALSADPSVAPEGVVSTALIAETQRTEQVPPAFSAIQIDGERSHALARSGKEVEHAPRPVSVRSLTLTSAGVPSEGLPHIELNALVSKGYYVRSLARDVGARVHAPAHLSALRRIQSGAFTIAASTSLDADAASLRAALLPIAAAASLAMPIARLTPQGTERARRGARLSASDFEEGALPSATEPSAWLDGAQTLVAVGEAFGSAFVVVRGFTTSDSATV